MVKNILLVEDETSLAKVLKKVIEHSGYQVAVTSNGAEALEYLSNQQTPDLILCDVTMPVMDGKEFCGILCNSPRYSNIPVILMSGLGEPKATCDKVPSYFLPKPFSINDLQSVMAVYLRND